MKNFTALAAEQIKADYFNTNNQATASDFNKYKRSGAYQDILKTEEQRLRREYFHSKENQKIWNVYRNHRLPAANDVYHYTKVAVEKALQKYTFGFIPRAHLGVHDVLVLNRTNYLMFTAMLNEENPLVHLYYLDETFYSLKGYISDFIEDEIYKNFFKLNKISENKNF